MPRVLVLLGLLACGKDPAPAELAPAPADARLAASAPAIPAIDAAPAVPAKVTMQLQLRSTPPGAEASLDGRVVGRTPVVVDVADDGLEHELLFVLPGHASERYRTRPLKSGVVHARLKETPASVLDAGR